MNTFISKCFLVLKKVVTHWKTMTLTTVIIFDVMFIAFALFDSVMIIGMSNVGLARSDIPKSERFYSEREETSTVFLIAMFFWFSFRALLFGLIYIVGRSTFVFAIARVAFYVAVAFLILAAITHILMFWEAGMERICERLWFYSVMFLGSVKFMVQSLWW